MAFFMNNILNIVCYVPLVGMILIMLMKRENETQPSSGSPTSPAW